MLSSENRGGARFQEGGEKAYDVQFLKGLVDEKGGEKTAFTREDQRIESVRATNKEEKILLSRVYSGKKLKRLGKPYTKLGKKTGQAIGN